MTSFLFYREIRYHGRSAHLNPYLGNGPGNFVKLSDMKTSSFKYYGVLKKNCYYYLIKFPILSPRAMMDGASVDLRQVN